MNPLSEEARFDKKYANGAKTIVDTHEANNGEILLSSAAFLLKSPI